MVGERDPLEVDDVAGNAAGGAVNNNLTQEKKYQTYILPFDDDYYQRIKKEKKKKRKKQIQGVFFFCLSFLFSRTLFWSTTSTIVAIFPVLGP